MLSAENFELCRPVLDDSTLSDEDKVEKLEEVLRAKTSLAGAQLENAVLDVLWRHRNSSNPGAADAPSRHTVIRKSSPAPWQMNRAPTPIGSPPANSSPSVPAAFAVPRPSFSRQKSTAPSPFASPRPSPRLAMAQPIPHSPSLNAYEFSVASPAPDIYGDFGSENVDWLVADDDISIASSTGTGSLSAAAPEWIPQPDMGPYDILRSVLGHKRTDEEIEEALESNSYDLGATIATLTGVTTGDAPSDSISSSGGAFLVGKSMSMNEGRPVTPSMNKSSTVCKYWLASGSCLRADCRFAHDASGHVCRYWMNGQCLAGDSCQFSHDPSLLMSNLNIGETASNYGIPTPPFQIQDQYDQFPSLNPVSRSSSQTFSGQNGGQFPNFTPLSQQRNRSGFLGHGPGSRPQSRPNSRHQNRPDLLNSLSVDDPDAFPTLASMNAKRTSKHHGHRSRHGHNNAEKEPPSSLADVVRMSSSPTPGSRKPADVGRKIRASGSSESAAARKIPEPQHIPWLETGARANQQYLKFRQEAIKHGSVRNKFLQSAAQAWNRSDARAAKALSLRGQAENDAMRKAHREAAKALYEERNQHLATTPVTNDSDDELYIDLHGLHPEEAIEYLDDVLATHSKRGRHIIYAITGTGHHSKNGKDKVGKGVRNWLNEWGYIFREFSVPGERGGYIGGVLGIDVTSHRGQSVTESKHEAPVTMMGGKIQLLKREEITT